MSRVVILPGTRFVLCKKQILICFAIAGRYSSQGRRRAMADLGQQWQIIQGEATEVL